MQRESRKALSGAPCFEKYKQLLEYQNLLLLSDIW
jgi:hypothetical protein